MNWRIALGVSTILHIVLVVMLSFANTTPKAKPVVTPKSQPKTINAISVDKSQVLAEVNKIKAEQEQKKQAELARVKKAERALAQAQKKRAREEKRLKQLEAKQDQEKKKLASAKKESKKAQQELSKLNKTKQQIEREKRLAKEKLDKLNKEKQQQAREKEKLKQQLAKEKAELDKAKAAKARADALAEAAKEKANKERLEALRAQVRQENQQKINHYTAVIKQKIQRNWTRPVGQGSELDCVLKVLVLPGGVVSSVTIHKSSGNVTFDNSAIRAVQKASPFSLPDDPDLYAEFQELILPFNPS